MDERLALRLLRRIMGWSEEVATREYAWVRLISRLKYDGYGDYVAGVRFAESLAGWLAQFDLTDRQTAYDFIRHRLIYFSSAELNRLVAQLVPGVVEPILRAAAGQAANVAPYLVLADPKAQIELAQRRRKTLFIGLSDGARIDILRRTNSGALVNDQIVLAMHIDNEKWRDLGEKLSEDLQSLGGGDAQFDNVFLIDDFTASGTTFIRKKEDGGWTGKIKKFFDAIGRARRDFETEKMKFPVSADVGLHIHHYISTTQARDTISNRLKAIEKEIPGWFPDVSVSEGLLLPGDISVDKNRDPGIWNLTEKYYDPDIYDQLRRHLNKSQLDLKRGYADCALPIVLEHNCPNNSLTLLWAETEGRNGAHAMRALFPRRHRHS